MDTRGNWRRSTHCSTKNLASPLADSVSYRTFCRVGALEGLAPSKSALAANFRKLRPSTLAQATVDYATCALVHVQMIKAPALRKLSQSLAHDLSLLQQVMVQTEQRVFDNISVSASKLKGDIGFVAYVHLDVLTANLLTLARHRLQ